MDMRCAGKDDRRRVFVGQRDGEVRVGRVCGGVWEVRVRRRRRKRGGSSDSGRSASGISTL